MNAISRRTVAKGAAWAAPTIALAASAPAYAASVPSAYFECPTTVADLSANLNATISTVVANNIYSSGPVLAPQNMDGSSFNISYETGAIKPVPIYNADGSLKGNSTGAYLIPGCGAYTCTPNVPGGFTLPTSDSVIVYDGYGKRHQGRVVAGTPNGCSPVTNLGISGTWSIATDIPYTGGCKPQAGPENFISQISIPVSLLYLDGLKVVEAKTGGSCCLYMNFTFDPKATCPGSSSGITASYTISPLPAPAPQSVVPHIYKTGPGYAKTGATITVVGGGFTGATKVTYNGVTTTFTVVSDNVITFTMPATGLAGIGYPVQVTTPGGVSNTDLLIRGTV